MRFSQRKKLSPIRETIQNEGMDNALRNRLWNLIIKSFDDQAPKNFFGKDSAINCLKPYWQDFFKLPVDDIPFNFNDAIKSIRNYFFNSQWFQVYDFMEFSAQVIPLNLAKQFIDDCNFVLEQEMSAYRFVGNQLTDITSEEEIESIEAALNSDDQFNGAKQHLHQALMHLSNRINPDFRNSIKESISAVESLCKVITNNPKATLGDAINKMNELKSFHPALTGALNKLYGYTSNADGIRHALLDETSISYHDAKFMLVSCSAFINYFIGILSDSNQLSTDV